MPDCYNKIYLPDKNITVDCKKCLNCIANMKHQYAERMIHEAYKYKASYFITNTYNDIYVPIKNSKLSLNKKHMRNYIMRINKHVKTTNGTWKYFASGEYGETTARPHYHAVILSNRPLLNYCRETWTYGNVKIENMWTYKAISYTVGYVNKKINDNKYEGIEKPFHKFSRGIGRDWIHEAIASGKVNEKNYCVRMQDWTTALPDYYKKILKDKITGYTTKYKKISESEKKSAEALLKNFTFYKMKDCVEDRVYSLHLENIIKKKTDIQYIDINTNKRIDIFEKIERDEAWNIFKEKVLLNLPLKFEQKEFKYLKQKYEKKIITYDYDEAWEYIDNKIINTIDKELENWYTQRNLLLKTEAENKYLRKNNLRTAI